MHLPILLVKALPAGRQQLCGCQGVQQALPPLPHQLLVLTYWRQGISLFCRCFQHVVQISFTSICRGCQNMPEDHVECELGKPCCCTAGCRLHSGSTTMAMVVPTEGVALVHLGLRCRQKAAATLSACSHSLALVSHGCDSQFARYNVQSPL